MSISDTIPGEPVRKSGSLISFKISMHFEPGITRIGKYCKGILHCVKLSIVYKPSDGRRRGRILFFDIRAPKTLQVYPPAIMFRATSCDRPPAKTIKPCEEGRVPQPQICPNLHRLLRTEKETAAYRRIRKANSN